MRNDPSLEPRWRPLAAVRPDMSPSWWDWLATQDSLTERLIEAGHPRRFRVRLLDQRHGYPSRDESLALGLTMHQLAWVREVALCLDDRPWVMARSVAPLNPAHDHYRLERLGERSMGSWLFRQPDLERGPIEICATSGPFCDAEGPWGRRSILRHDRFTVLVQEFFQQAMVDDLGLPSR
ncbi:chorismate--pyruvate lyase family protein [Halomonas caseinilytica]|uniref:chorismate--pyruvate lyase family protein n=2 Tax=Halomonas caseinilytica TaxID=438744 RepID=UPI0007E59676|nr:chorismate lyase [Halomonas caseinilytica]